MKNKKYFPFLQENLFKRLTPFIYLFIIYSIKIKYTYEVHL